MAIRAKPFGYTGEHEAYLNQLRESGDTNMFGAAPYLEHVFDLDRHIARDYLLYWMEAFGGDE